MQIALGSIPGVPGGGIHPVENINFIPFFETPLILPAKVGVKVHREHAYWDISYSNAAGWL